jgi:excisionase family DNA binding protein
MAPIHVQVTEPPELMTVAEVAAMFRVSDETIHRWCRSGTLPFIPMPSGLKRFRREEVEAILAGEPSVRAS